MSLRKYLEILGGFLEIFVMEALTTWLKTSKSTTPLDALIDTVHFLAIINVLQ